MNVQWGPWDQRGTERLEAGKCLILILSSNFKAASNESHHLEGGSRPSGSVWEGWGVSNREGERLMTQRLRQTEKLLKEI